MFGLNLAGQGTIDLVGDRVPDLTNTHTISAGSLTLFYWNELNSPSTFTLASGDFGDGYDDHAECGGTAVSGDLIQIDSGDSGGDRSSSGRDAVSR